jgi:hypothetical protein
MATLTSNLIWFDRPNAMHGVVSMLYKVQSDKPWNQRIARIYRFPSGYGVQFVGREDDQEVSALSFESLDDAKAYARVTALLTLKGNHEPIESHPLGR